MMVSNIAMSGGQVIKVSCIAVRTRIPFVESDSFTIGVNRYRSVSIYHSYSFPDVPERNTVIMFILSKEHVTVLHNRYTHTLSDLKAFMGKRG